MKVKDLIEQLGHCNPEADVTALDQWEDGQFKIEALLYDEKLVQLLPADD